MKLRINFTGMTVICAVTAYVSLYKGHLSFALAAATFAFLMLCLAMIHGE
jgi:hypothetical protein